MSIQAVVIADSVNEYGNRLTTLQLKFHRFILPEFNTHRALSRNTRSERAVPTKTLLDEVRTNPAIPIRWGKNQAGMQAHEELTGTARKWAEAEWRGAALSAANHAERLAELGAHKQIVNRIISPYTWAHTLVSATEWSNFFALRRHEDAQPEIKELADRMHEAMEASTPVLLRPGEWHLPYVRQAERGWYDLDTCIKLSVARCARVSYRPFDGNTAIEKEIERYHKLVGNVPMHSSPAEHQGEPDTTYVDVEMGASFTAFSNPHLHGNFVGFRQFRKTLPNECL